MKTARLILRVIGAAAIALLPVAAHAQTHASHLGGGGDIDVSLGRIVISLVICIIIAALAVLLLRQRNGKIDLAAFFSRLEPRAREITVVETKRLSPHADISVVRQGGREYLLILQAGNAHVLRDQPVDSGHADLPCA